MKLETLSITNISVRGYLKEVVNPTELADTRDKQPSSVTSDTVMYLKPMSRKIEIFYGGEFLISQASNLDEIKEARSVIEDELELQIDEFEYHRVTVSGDLKLGGSRRVEKLGQSLEDNGSLDNLMYGSDNRFGGDLYFKLNSNTVRLFINQDEPLYSVAGIPVSSETSLSNDIREQKDTLESVLTGSCSE